MSNSNEEKESNVISLFWWKHQKLTKPTKTTDELIRDAFVKQRKKQNQPPKSDS